MNVLNGCRWGNINGMVSSNIYRKEDSPRFYLGHSVVLAYLVLFLFGGSVITTLYLRHENRLRRTGRRDQWLQRSKKEIDVAGDERWVAFPFPFLFLLVHSCQEKFLPGEMMC